MADAVERAIAIVGVGAVLPDAPDVAAFWDNVTSKRYSISEVDPTRWDPDFYFDADRQAIDKSYSKIGGWVREWDWKPLEWRLPIPPKVSDAMDRTQQWAIVAARQALTDYGYPERPLDGERTAVIVGNAMGGDLHYLTALSVYFPEYADELRHAPTFAALAPDIQQRIVDEMRSGMQGRFPSITEDTMPGELANIIAGRLANLFDFHGPNFVVDAACASAMAAIDAAVEGLETGDFDAVITGGVDANMSASTFVKFCKIGALSATGTRPFGDGADGFVMGEGAALFLLKRLADAERDDDHIYAVIRGIGGASDGKGKGITAPNPVGQRLAIRRAWQNAGITPNADTLIEAHGTSTKVGDVVEAQSIADAFAELDLRPGTLALGSVKSNIGHLKGAAGAAGMLKVALSLDHKVLPPSLGAETPNPNIDFAHSPVKVNTELRDWDANGTVRSAAVSAFGFGGTNFHMVLEEHIPGRLTVARSATAYSVGTTAGVVAGATDGTTPDTNAPVVDADLKAPLRGTVVVGGVDDAEVSARLASIQADAVTGAMPPISPPNESDLRAHVRVAIDFGTADELAGKAAKALKALDSHNEAAWRLLANQGVFRGEGAPHQVAMLYTGQGSQYVNMLADLRRTEPIVRDTFAEADRIMEPLIGRPLSEIIFVDPDDDEAVAAATEQLRQTEITQPAVLTTDLALTRLLDAYGIQADMVMGHSLGEYAALVAAGALPFADALEAVSARGREMAHVSVADVGLMSAVFAPIEEIRQVLDTIDDYVEIANINSGHQAVIGGSTPGVEAASAALTAAGHQVVPLPVSHAFHTSIVAPAADPLRTVLERLDVNPPVVPTIANVDGRFYPMGPAVVPDMIDILCRQIASPVQFIAGLHTLHDAGARVFIEVGPKRALHGFVEDVFADESDVVALFTNHPKSGDIVSFNQSLCGLYAAGLGVGTGSVDRGTRAATSSTPTAPLSTANVTAPSPSAGPARDASGVDEPVVITGAGLGLPGTDDVFSDDNLTRLLDGNSFIDAIPVTERQAIVDKHITRLVKNDSGGANWETIDSQHDVIKLAGQKGRLDLVEQFGLSADRVAALDTASELAIGAGIDALRDAGIPLTMHYKSTTTGGTLPEHWALPEALRDDTGIIFASAFPGYDRLTDEITRYEADRSRRARLADLTHLRDRISDDDPVVPELEHMMHELAAELEQHPYTFDRRFLFKVLSMGHSQFAEHIGARGPNTQINSACASTTQAVSLAEDWIRLGRCSRVIIVSGDDVTSDSLIEWIGAGFLASGAAATDEVVEEAALPFDRRRHGMILGMGAAAIVVESAASARARGVTPICEVLSAVSANSAFHGSRLDVEHIKLVMEDLIAQAERRWGVQRRDVAEQGVFVSHETYTPARGGSAQAEVEALRFVFGQNADRFVIANTKGFTGHAMGVGVEDVLAVKSLETGIVPPIANVKEADPALGALNLSKGGAYPVNYALRLGAGFGSQISMSLMRWVPTADGRHREADELGVDYRVPDAAARQQWLAEVSGYATPELEVVQRTLRIRNDGPPAGITIAPKRSAAHAPDVLEAPAALADAGAGPNANTTSTAPAATHIELVSDTSVSDTPAAPAAPAAPVASDAPAQAPATGDDEVVAMVLGVVAEQTGYPADMLELDLDLEADLGIDTVKQAETFAAIREHYQIPRDDNLSLRDYPTLAHVVGFVRQHTGITAPTDPGTGPNTTSTAPAATHTGLVSDTSVSDTTAAPAAPLAAAAPAAPDTPAAPVASNAPAQAPATGDDEVVAMVLGVVAEQTGYPADMLELDLDLEADLGIDTVKQAETFAAIREHYQIPRDDNLSLRDYPTLAHVVGFVRQHTGITAPTDPGTGPNTTSTAPAATHTGLVSDTSVSDTTAAPAAPLAAAAPAAPDTPAAPVASDAPAQAPATGDDEVVAMVLGVVAEQTGYPADMLELDLDLEADLGIDTVKQAETFAAIREHYQIPRDDNLSLRDYPTLAHVVGFVRQHTGITAPTDPGTGPNTTSTAPAATHTGLVSDTSVSDTTAAPAAPLAAAAPAAPDTPAAPVASDAPAQAPATGDDEVVAMVLGVVAEQTGYPADMLELDLDLEADLGIDTVKQAETFAAIREHYQIPRDDNLSLRDYPTLAHVVGFVRQHTGITAPTDPGTGPNTTSTAPAATHTGLVSDTSVSDTTAAPAAPLAAAAPAAPDTPAAPVASDAPAQALAVGDDEASAAVRRRVPVPVMRPPLDLCVDTGIVLDDGAAVLVMSDEGGIGKALAKRLEQRGVDVLMVDDAPVADELLPRIADWLGERALRGIYWLPALDVEPHITEESLEDWREGLRRRVKLLYRVLRDRYDDFAASSFLVTGTRLGGEHGYGPDEATAPMGGGVVGLAKAFKREHPDTLVKAVDFPMSRKKASYADVLIDETLRDPGAVEIGWLDERRCAIALEDRAVPDHAEAITLDKDSVFVVTGAAGSIVSAIIGDLARASGGTFHLLDLAPAPDPSDADVLAFEEHHEELKRTIFERLKEAGERATPAIVERELSRIERRHAALAALQAIESSGGTAHYHQVDLRDGDAMATEMAKIGELSGTIDVLVHAAGLEISRSMPDKSPDEYDLVFDVKADGWFNLVKGIGHVPLDSAVVFSSIAGRFGNAGQTDYSAANDLLCKQVSALDPDTLGIAIDWTAWGDIGMATRGSIPQIMEAAGIDMLPAAAGIPVVRRELTGGGVSREIVVAGRLGLMTTEFHDTGGLAVGPDAPIAGRAAEVAALGRTEVRAMTLADGLIMSTTLDPATQPFLDDHRIDGTPVLPGVMGVELFATAASLLFPDLHLVAVEDVDFLAPFKFFRDEPRELIVMASFERAGHEIVVHCRLIGERLLANQTEPQTTLHFTGTVRLGAEHAEHGPVHVVPPNESVVTADDIYGIYFHGPAYQVLIEGWADHTEMYGRYADPLPAATDPPDAPLRTAPRLLELCFQTAGVWEIGTSGTMALPMHLERVTFGDHGSTASSPLVAIVTPADDGSFDAVVVDGDSHVRATLSGYRTVRMPGTIDDGLVAPLRAAVIGGAGS